MARLFVSIVALVAGVRFRRGAIVAFVRTVTLGCWTKRLCAFDAECSAKAKAKRQTQSAGSACCSRRWWSLNDGVDAPTWMFEFARLRVGSNRQSACTAAAGACGNESVDKQPVESTFLLQPEGRREGRNNEHMVRGSIFSAGLKIIATC